MFSLMTCIIFVFIQSFDAVVLATGTASCCCNFNSKLGQLNENTGK